MLIRISLHPSVILNAGNLIRKKSLALTILLAYCTAPEEKDTIVECLETKPPPFGGTIFIDPDIITPDDPLSLIHI